MNTRNKEANNLAFVFITGMAFVFALYFVFVILVPKLQALGVAQ